MIEELRKWGQRVRAGATATRSDDSTVNPTTMMTRAYVLALGLIALLTVGSHILTSHITTMQGEGSAISFGISGQRAMIQDVGRYAAKYLATGDQLDHAFLTQTAADLEASHENLIRLLAQKDWSGRQTSPILSDMYAAEPYRLDASLRNYVAVAKAFASIPVGEENEERALMVRDLSERLPATIVQNLDTALARYRNEAQSKTDWYYEMQLYSGVFVFLVLLLEAVFIFRPLTRKVGKYHDILLRYALEDTLTGLNNRRAFTKLAESELAQARRTGESYVVVLCDLDRFKSVNDTYGHKVGDLVLKHFSAQLQKLLRAGDVIGRFGGEEFVLFLPRTAGDVGFRTIDRLRARVAQTPCPYVDESGQTQNLSYTASFGLVAVDPSAWPDGADAPGLDALLTLADTGLYQAKDQGRNCAVAVPLAVDVTPASADYGQKVAKTSRANA